MKAQHLVWARRISQAFFLFLFLFLLVETRLPQDFYIDVPAALSTEQDIRLEQPVTFFFELDPLVWLTSLLSGHQWIKGFLWAIAIFVSTFFLGRFFCGFICPLGTIHHMMSWIKPALKGDRMVRANQKTPSQRVKYFVLIALLIAAFLGLNLAGLLDPISFLFRSVALAFLPGLGVAIRGFFDLLAQSDVKALNLLTYSAEVFVSPVFGYEPKAFQTAWFIGALFLFILFLNRLKPRFWCRTLCPLGALLGFCSRFSILKLEKYPEKCTNCNLCTKNCQGAATPIPDQDWETAECLMCFNCFNVCPEDALSFGFKLSPRANKRPDMGRRAVLGGLVAGISLPFLGRLDGQIDKVSDSRLIRPPGSLPEKEFITLCQRCGLCILCGSVCPTGAIKDITVKEKIQGPIRIGSAYVVRGRCLPWSGNAPCIVCEEHCPTSPKAIYLREDFVPTSDGKELKVQLPYVDLKRCVGCGICENKCPVKGKPAIRIIAAGESRSLKNQILLGL
jgi:polyferredoxin/NAD-dependent dihydropyrimidine dehydrogenase PreA subunit